MNLEKKLKNVLIKAEKALVDKNTKIEKQQEHMQNLYQKMIKIKEKYEAYNATLMEKSKGYQEKANKDINKVNEDMEDLRNNLSNNFQEQVSLEAKVETIKELLGIKKEVTNGEESTEDKNTKEKEDNKAGEGDEDSSNERGDGEPQAPNKTAPPLSSEQEALIRNLRSHR